MTIRNAMKALLLGLACQGIIPPAAADIKPATDPANERFQKRLEQAKAMRDRVVESGTPVMDPAASQRDRPDAYQHYQRRRDQTQSIRDGMVESGTLGGDTRAACEALMCLMAPGSLPHECDPPLQRYFSIKHKKWRDTANARQSFLDQCPKQDRGRNQDIVVRTRQTSDTDEPDAPVVRDPSTMTPAEIRAEIAATWSAVSGLCPAVSSLSTKFRVCFQEKGSAACQTELEAFTILQNLLMSRKSRVDELARFLGEDPPYCPG